MHRLIIVDDERIIREAISSCIDWNKIGIELIGVCKNGVEAYNMILDTHPDIVLTDIQMPILSGLQLIKQVSRLNLSIEFVILSGYSDFSYATEAMKYGIQHYLLKPCSPEEIITTMQEVIHKCNQKASLKQLQNQHEELINLHEQNIISSAIIAILSHKNTLEQAIDPFIPYTDIYNTSYTQYQFNSLNIKKIDYILKQLIHYQQTKPPSICFFYLHTEEQLTIFYKSTLTTDETHQYSEFLNQLATSSSITEQETMYHHSLYHLFEALRKHFSSYNLIYLIYSDTKFPIYNYHAITQKYNQDFSAMTINKLDQVEIELLLQNTVNIDNFALVKSLISNYVLQNYFENCISYTSTEILETITEINKCETKEQIYSLLKKRIDTYYCEQNTCGYKDFIQRILDYIDTNYSDSHLTLKWIAENYLYMNVDYVSKQFSKQMGIRFSSYLSKIRIEKAKKLLLDQGSDKIYEVAKLTGFGNNPQYFSQTFKRHTGMTPTEFISSTNDL